MSEEKVILSVRNLKTYFDVTKGIFSPKQIVKAVDDVSFDINENETFGLVGESGCGKTTLGRTIVKLYEPESGNIFFQGKDIAKLKGKELIAFRKDMQMIFQDPYASLNARMTVQDIVAEPLRAHHLCKNKADERELVAEMLHRVGLNQEHAGRYAHEFSGGQRQRVGIARALILQPQLVICDEPISALDVSIQAQVVNMLRNFQEEQGLTYLFIAHDLSMVRYVSDDVGVMYLGQLVEKCGTDEIYAHPLHPYTQGLLSSVPIPDPVKARQKEKAGIAGDIPSPIAPPAGCRFHTRCPYAEGRCRSEVPAFVEAAPGHYVACHKVS